MDKYINRDELPGLDLLSDPKKRKNNTNNNKEKTIGKVEVKFIKKNYLTSFKQFIKNKIKTFDPTICNDEFDTLLIAIWHQYIFYNVDSSNYSEFVTKLNPQVNLDSDKNDVISDVTSDNTYNSNCNDSLSN